MAIRTHFSSTNNSLHTSLFIQVTLPKQESIPENIRRNVSDLFSRLQKKGLTNQNSPTILTKTSQGNTSIHQFNITLLCPHEKALDAIKKYFPNASDDLLAWQKHLHDYLSKPIPSPKTNSLVPSQQQPNPQQKAPQQITHNPPQQENPTLPYWTAQEPVDKSAESAEDDFETIDLSDTSLSKKNPIKKTSSKNESDGLEDWELMDEITESKE